MNRDRFEQILAAYGADPQRWPEAERAAAEAFAAANTEAVAAFAEARGVDRLLDHAQPVPDTGALAARILAMAPAKAARTFDRRAVLALAACAVFGVVLGYGGGLLAPVADADDYYFTAAFEAPLVDGIGDEG